MIEPNPLHSNVYAAAEHSHDTRQAQHSMSNDTPTDVNINAIFARSQALTSDALGKGFTSNHERLLAEMNAAAARRTILADKAMDGGA